MSGPLALAPELSPNRPAPWLAAALHQTIHGSRGRVKQIAYELKVADRVVYEIAAGDAPLKVWHVPGLIRATQCYAVLDALEAQVDRVAFRMLAPASPFDPLHRELARAVRSFGEFLDVNGDALEDGRLDAAELDELLTRLDLTIAALCQYRAAAVVKAEGDASTPRADDAMRA